MELIIIYGPPASGKLTVAKELEKITGFNVLHNHLTGDISSAIYNFGSKRYKKFVRKLRKIILKEASKSEAKIIFTFVYGKGIDDKFIKKLINISKKRKKNKISFIWLRCSKNELEKRVISPERTHHGKLGTKKELRKDFQKYNSFSKIPFIDSIEINNTRLSPKKTAKKIKKELNLI